MSRHICTFLSALAALAVVLYVPFPVLVGISAVCLCVIVFHGARFVLNLVRP